MNLAPTLRPGLFWVALVATPLAGLAYGQSDRPLSIEKINENLNAVLSKVSDKIPALESLTLQFDPEKTHFLEDKSALNFAGTLTHSAWSNEPTTWKGSLATEMSSAGVEIFGGVNLSTNTVSLMDHAIEKLQAKRCKNTTIPELNKKNYKLVAEQRYFSNWCEKFDTFQIREFEDVGDFLTGNATSRIDAYSDVARELRQRSQDASDKGDQEKYLEQSKALKKVVASLRQVKADFQTNENGDTVAIVIQLPKNMKQTDGLLKGVVLKDGQASITPEKFDLNFSSVKTDGLLGYTLLKKNIIVPFLQSLENYDDSKPGSLLPFILEAINNLLKDYVI